MAGGDRSRADSLLLAALTAGQTVEGAAKLAGVSPRTVARRLEDPDFKSALADARRALLSQALGRLADGTTEAAEALRRNLKCGLPSVEVVAAKAILAEVRAAIELDDLAGRVAALEAAADAALPKGRRWSA